MARNGTPPSVHDVSPGARATRAGRLWATARADPRGQDRHRETRDRRAEGGPDSGDQSGEAEEKPEGRGGVAQDHVRAPEGSPTAEAAAEDPEETGRGRRREEGHMGRAGGRPEHGPQEAQGGLEDRAGPKRALGPHDAGALGRGPRSDPVHGDVIATGAADRRSGEGRERRVAPQAGVAAALDTGGHGTAYRPRRGAFDEGASAPVYRALTASLRVPACDNPALRV